jgi:predicted phage tail protein
MTMTTVRLYGEMGRQFGRVHQFALDANTPAEALQALIANFPKIEAYLMGAKDRGIGFAVFRGKRNLSEDELKFPVKNDDIRIAPIIIGSKSGGVFSVILGVILVVVGAVIDWWTGGTGGNQFIGYGIGLIAGGVAQMLAATPKGLNKNQAAANTPNYAFSGPVNTQAQGNPVPVLYGEMIVGSAVISAGIFTDNQVIASQPATPVEHGGMGGGGNSAVFEN